MLFRFGILLVSFVCLLGCKPSVRNEEVLSKYVQTPENGLYKEVVSGQLKTVAYYKPVDLLLATMAKDRSLTASDSSMVKNSYFVIEMSYDGEDLEYLAVGNPVVAQFLLNPQMYFSLTADQQELNIYSVVYQPMAGITHKSSFMLATESISSLPATTKELSLKINLKPVFGFNNNFTFLLKDIKNTPSLHI